MKKLKFAMAALVVGLTMVSCSGDDDNGSSASIEGKWLYSKQGVAAGGQEQLMDYPNEEGCNKDYTELLSGGAAKDVSYWGSECEEEMDEGTWTKEGNTLNMTMDGETISAEILNLTGSELKIGVTETMGGVEATYITVFTRG